MFQVGEVMYPVNRPLHAEMSLPEAVDIILKSGFIGLPVVDDDNHVVGFLSEHDCMPLLLKGSYHSDIRTLVRDIMHAPPLLATPQQSIVDLAMQMHGQKPKVYPVVARGLLVGLVTRSHVMRALHDAYRASKTVA